MSSDLTSVGVGSDIAIGRPAYSTVDFDATTTALSNIPGVARNVVAGSTYFIRDGAVTIVADATGGWKLGIGGTAGIDTAALRVVVYNTSAGILDSVSVYGGIGTTLGSGAGAATYSVLLAGWVRVLLDGTLTLQFAQKVAAPGTPSTVLAFSFFSPQLAV